MEQRICLDTDVIINYLKGNETATINSVLEEPKNILFTTSINAFELRSRKTNLEQAENFLSKIHIASFDDYSSKIASHLFLKLKEKGALVEFRDIFIAATCISNNAKLHTNNKKHFKRFIELAIV